MRARRRQAGTLRAMWRTEDESLLGRLEDELVLDALARDAAGGLEVALPPRASGLVADLRQLPSGAAAVERVVARLLDADRPAGSTPLAGATPLADRTPPTACPLAPLDLDEVRALACPASLRALPPALLHRLALFHGRAAEALRRAGSEAAPAMQRRALGAWLALAEERHYVARLARAVLGEAADDAAMGQAFDEVVFAPLRGLGRIAKGAAHDLEPGGASALRALGEVPLACRLAGVGGDLARRATRHADRQRAAAVEVALAPIGEALREARARGRANQDGPALSRRLFDVWVWSDHDEDAERCLVDQFTAVCWSVYREPGVEPIRRLLAPAIPLVESLAARIEGDPTRVAYAAGCATLLVFVSEGATSKDEQRRFAELAVAVCPVHRNGRVVLANALCAEADRLLARGGARAAAAALAERVSDLHPDAPQLASLRHRCGIPAPAARDD